MIIDNGQYPEIVKFLIVIWILNFFIYISAVTMADKNNTDNKRHLSDTFRSFSDVVRMSKKKKGIISLFATESWNQPQDWSIYELKATNK